MGKTLLDLWNSSAHEYQPLDALVIGGTLIFLGGGIAGTRKEAKWKRHNNTFA